MPHVACRVQDVLRCSAAVWYVFAGHAEHVRLAFLEAALVSCPLPHVACGVHPVIRCDAADWKVFAGQAAHVREAVLDSALMYMPFAHVGCAEHDVPRCDVAATYVLLGHALQARLAALESALMNCPLPHVAYTVHDVLVELGEAWYVLAPHARQLLPDRWYPAPHAPQWFAWVRLSCVMSAPFLHDPAPVHSRSTVALGALDSYSLGLHRLACVAQTRSDVALPATFWYSPLVQTSHLAHAVTRWPRASWNVLVEQPEHVRRAVLVSTLIFCPAAHVACAVHVVLRW